VVGYNVNPKINAVEHKSFDKIPKIEPIQFDMMKNEYNKPTHHQLHRPQAIKPEMFNNLPAYNLHPSNLSLGTATRNLNINIDPKNPVRQIEVEGKPTNLEVMIRIN